jgi:hypothetical protein
MGMHRLLGGFVSTVAASRILTVAIGFFPLLFLAACGGGGGGGSTGSPPRPSPAAPTVVAVTPTDGSSNTALSTPITVTFSTTMDAATISGSTIRIQSVGVDVTGALAYGTTYQVTISKEVRDLTGTPMSQDFTWQFTTAQAPSGSLAGVLSLDGNLGIHYDNATRTATITTSEIVPLEETTVKAVQTGSDYTTVSYEASTTTAAPGTFSFPSLPDGRYFLIAEKTDSSGTGNQFLGLVTVSLLGFPKVVSVVVRDVTPTASTNRQDLLCRECHPTTVTAPGQVQSCIHPTDLVPVKANGPAGNYDPYGRVTCGSCHSAHYPTGVLHFCKATYDDGILCLQCH